MIAKGTVVVMQLLVTSVMLPKTIVRAFGSHRTVRLKRLGSNVAPLTVSRQDHGKLVVPSARTPSSWAGVGSCAKLLFGCWTPTNNSRYLLRGQPNDIRLYSAKSEGGSLHSTPQQKVDVEISPSNHGTTPLLTFKEEKNRNNSVPLFDERLLTILDKDKMITPTPIQSHAIPLLLRGHDVMASAQTGSGKTLMFALPLAQRLLLHTNNHNNNNNHHGAGSSSSFASPSALILSPTRELAQQTATVLRRLTSRTVLKVALATGGSDSKSQRRAMLDKKGGCDILVGTPGRILQFIDERSLRLRTTCIEVVIDEADRMLDLGFEPQLRRIARALGRPAVIDPSDSSRRGGRHTVLCSATFPPNVQRVASEFLKGSYYFVAAGRVGATHGNIEQTVRWVDGGISDRRRMAVEEVRRHHASVEKGGGEDNKGKKGGRRREEEDGQRRVIVFTNTKDEAERLGSALRRSIKGGNGIRVVHGDKTQTDRNKSLAAFRDGRAQTLVATDVAARGLDVAGVGLVVQVDAPRDVDSYVHRVGRTGRAGRGGRASVYLDGRSVSMAPDLVKVLREAGQECPPWLVGMSHVATARSLEEEGAIAAGGGGSLDDSIDDGSRSSSLSGDSLSDEQFTGQDFRSSAAAGTWGSERDTTYRSFDEEAYSSFDDLSGTESAGASVEEETNDEDSDGEFNVDRDEEGGEDGFTRIEGLYDSTEEPKTAPLMSEDSEESLRLQEPPFQRRKPSKELKQAVKRISGSDEIGDTPNSKVLSALSKRGPNQRLRFEYIGMFPYEAVAESIKPRGTGNTLEGRYGNMPRILMVAEKPSIAKAIADALAGPNGARQRRGISRALPVYEFTSSSFQPCQLKDANGKSTRCLVTVTSVVGHVFSLAFEEKTPEGAVDSPENRPSYKDPSEYFRIPVVKQEEGTTGKLRVVDHLRALAAESDHLVLWLDCDAEGENIAHEVIGVTRRALKQRASEHRRANPNAPPVRRVHRAKFSAITRDALRDAFSNLAEPDAALSRSVDARQELDLRVGVAMTRLLTWRCVGLARRHFSPATKLVSYGPCQTPALSFCVDRAREIDSFIPTDYWKVHVTATVPNEGKSMQLPLRWKVTSEDAVESNRGSRGSQKEGKSNVIFEDSSSFNKIAAQQVVNLASTPNSVATVISVEDVSERMNAPLGLNTVALLSAGSKAMGMSPKQVMNVAEKLYSAGFISYPRTETSKYDPKGFDVRSVLRQHTSHPEWGRTASHLLRTKYAKSGRPPQRGYDAGDHPPITTLKSATREEIGGGAAWRVYEFVTRNFLGSLSDELLYSRRVAELELDDMDGSVHNRRFELEQVNVDSLGFAGACRWVLRDIGANKPGEGISLQEGMELHVAGAQLEHCTTKPPRFLQEHELIELMDKNRIGTDASMATHVNNIVDRGYVVLCDETGEPLRPPRPPGPGRAQRPRQIGRYLVPTPLGCALLDLFGGLVHEDQIFDTDNSAATFNMPSTALLARPSIRAQMEVEVAQIASGQLDKAEVLAKNIEWFEARYNELESSLSRPRTNEFASSLEPTKASLISWRRLGAFEPAVLNHKQHDRRRKGTGKRKPARGKVSSKQRSSRRTRKRKRATPTLT